MVSFEFNLTRSFLRYSTLKQKGHTSVGWSSNDWRAFDSYRTKQVIFVICYACLSDMMTSSNGNIFRVIAHLCRDFTTHWWIPRTRLVTQSFDVFFDLRLCGRLSQQSCVAGDLRRHRANYDVIVRRWFILCNILHHGGHSSDFIDIPRKNKSSCTNS